MTPAAGQVSEGLVEGLTCEVCRQQPPGKRLLMELEALRAVQALRRALRSEEEPLSVNEKRDVNDELCSATFVLEELRRHRRHTPFFKVVGYRVGGQGQRRYFSIYDGRTPYVIGEQSTMELGAAVGGGATNLGGGIFVHASLEEAENSVAAFPRRSAAWAAPRAVLAVRGEGSWRLRHGKVVFDAITPLQELPCAPENQLRSWRR